jgi:predicted metalloprotease with PDZ domain
MRQFQLGVVALLFCLVPMLAVSVRANMAPPMDFIVGLTLEKTADGPRIATIAKGGVADKAGLKVGDLILGIDEHYAKTMSDEDLRAFTDDSHPWPFEVIVARGNDIVTVRLSR